MRPDRRKQQRKESLWRRKIRTEGQQMKTRMLRLNKTTRSLICQVDLSLSLCPPVLLSLFRSSCKNNMQNNCSFSMVPFIENHKFSLCIDEGHLSFCFFFHVCILSDFLNGKHFFLYGKFPNNDRRLLLRYIIAFNGWVWHRNYTSHL